MTRVAANYNEVPSVLLPLYLFTRLKIRGRGRQTGEHKPLSFGGYNRVTLVNYNLLLPLLAAGNLHIVYCS